MILLELMHDAGIKASKAGTALRRGMVNMLNPTVKQKEVIDELGISIKNGYGEMRSMLAISKQLATKGITPAQIAILFGARAVAGWAQVIAEANGKMKEFEDAQKDVAGESLKLRAQLENNLTDQFKMLGSAVQELQHLLFEEFGPGLVQLVKDAKEWTIELGASKDTVVAAAQGVGVFILAVGALSAAHVVLTSATFSYTLALLANAGPMGILAVGAGRAALANGALTLSSITLTKVLGGLRKVLGGLRIALTFISSHPIVAALVAATSAVYYFTKQSNKAADSQSALSSASNQSALAQGKLETSASKANKELRAQVKLQFGAKLAALSAAESQASEALSLAKSRDQMARLQSGGSGGSMLQRNLAASRKYLEKTGRVPSPLGEGKKVSADTINALTEAYVKAAAAHRAYRIEMMRVLGTYEASAEAEEDRKKDWEKNQLIAFEAYRQKLLSRAPVTAADDPKAALLAYKDLADKESKLTESRVSELDRLQTLGAISPYENMRTQISVVTEASGKLTDAYATQKNSLEDLEQQALSNLEAAQLSKDVGPDTLARYMEAADEATEALVKLEAQHRKEARALREKNKELRAGIEYAQKYVVVPNPASSGGPWVKQAPTLSDPDVWAGDVPAGGPPVAYTRSPGYGQVQLGEKKKTPAELMGFVGGLREESLSGTSAGLDDEYAKEKEALQAARDTKITIQDTGQKQALINEAEYLDRSLQLNISYAKKQDALWGGHHQKIFDFAESARKDDKAGMLSNGIAMLDIGAKQSKKVFKLQKNLAIAQAIISTQKGIAEAWGFGPILGPAMAALVALNGFAAVKAIRAQEYNGGGGLTSPASSVPTSAPEAPVDQGGRGVTIYIEGNLYANEDFRRTLVETLELAQSNDEIRIQSNDEIRIL